MKLFTRRPTAPEWDPTELHGLVEDLAAEQHGPTDSELEARAWDLIADMDRQHALAQWWHSWESQAGGYAADLAAMPMLVKPKGHRRTTPKTADRP